MLTFARNVLSSWDNRNVENKMKLDNYGKVEKADNVSHFHHRFKKIALCQRRIAE